MSGFREKDFLKKLIEQFGQVLARVLKLKRENKYDEALQALDGACQDLVGVPRSLLDRMDAKSSAQLIGDAKKVRFWSQILREEWEIRASQGAESLIPLQRATELMLEATWMSAPTPEDQKFLSGVRDALPPGALAEKYQQRLNEVLAPTSAG